MSLVDTLPEKTIQQAIRRCLSDPTRLWNTIRNETIQILAPGRIALHGGPDFQSIALLHNGEIHIGNAEYHRKSSDWLAHNHDANTNFDSTILHIVSEYDQDIKKSFYTVIIAEEEIAEALNRLRVKEKDEAEFETLSEIQYFALLRLMRKSTEVKNIIEKADLQRGIAEIAKTFLTTFENKRRRPLYSPEQIHNIGNDFVNSSILQRIFDTEKNSSMKSNFDDFLRTKFSTEGEHLRREIFLNCLFPLTIAMTNDDKRMEAFSWFWSVKALHPYGILSRQFPTIPQDFLWQQQGMLEYRRTHGERGNLASEALHTYGFGRTFSFFKDASANIIDDISLSNADYDIAEDIIDIE